LGVLGFNARGERHHLRWGISTWLFLRGVPLDRIHLRPCWLVPWKRDRTRRPDQVRVIEGRGDLHGKPYRVLTPYLPYPLSHGGAVRLFNLLRECAREFDITLFGFVEDWDKVELGPVLEFCARAVLVEKPYYREPRWSTWNPPEAGEYESPAMRRALRDFGQGPLQVEYTQLARYQGDILVEHDVTFDLYAQIRRTQPGVSNWWNWFRWRRFEKAAVKGFAKVVVMSEKDRELLGVSQATVIPNGVDLARYQPIPETGGGRILFIGSFRHFPNVTAIRWFLDEVWPLLPEEFRLTVVAGPDPAAHAQLPDLPRVEVLGFVADVRPLYHEANLVIVPTQVSAGTNIKVLEAWAMERAIVSTSSGCAGMGASHGETIWIADEPEAFASAIVRLLRDSRARQAIAQAGRAHVQHFGWEQVGRLQRNIWNEMVKSQGR
jgi:glycosyltransferase involved in cell wall biosynthesis